MLKPEDLEARRERRRQEIYLRRRKKSHPEEFVTPVPEPPLRTPEPEPEIVKWVLPDSTIDEPDLVESGGRYKNIVIEKGLCSVIILTHERVTQLKGAIKSFYDNTKLPLELIVLEAGSSPEIQRSIYDIVLSTRWWHRRQIIFSIENPHSNAMINKGYAAARGEHVFISNDDVTVMSPYWAERMIAHSQKLKDVGIIGACGTGSYFKQVLPRGWDTEDHIGEYIEPDQISGILNLIPRQTWKTIGSYDEHLSPRCGGDGDYCIRCRAKGLRLYSARDVYVRHDCFAQSAAWIGAFAYNKKKYGVNYINEVNGNKCVKVAKELYDDQML